MNPDFKPFEDMTDADYAEIGLRSGLEIHQQVLTEKKLFCRCPAGRYSDVYDAEILRHMRPTLSELGEYDGTALMEFKTRKEIIYRINHETVCTYEMDDTPPFEINQKALDIALEIAMLLNYKLVSEIHVARKQYLDGSIPTGFQRTTIVGIDGWIPYKDRKIGLIQLGLEEDACREVSDIGHTRIYQTDRLGMPLIETVTEPDMRTPQEVAEVAEILRRLVRSTGKVRTGIGAARQDVNVSITGGTRVEIKGVSRIPLIPLLIYNEAMRQHFLLRIRDELNRRGITSDSLKTTQADVTGLLAQTGWEPLRLALSRGERVRCVNLKGFAGILRHPLQTGKVFSKEISDRVRVIACITRLPNIVTSEGTEETIDSFIWPKIRKAVSAEEKDAQILVWGGEADVTTAVKEIIIRAKEAAAGVPNETRQALEDGTNGFERILPGADRMYPDTDLPPLEIPVSRIEELQKNVPDPVWERIPRYRDMGIPEHLLVPLASSPQAGLFEELSGTAGLPAVRIAVFLMEKQKAWARRRLDISRLDADVWRTFFAAAAKHPALLEKGDELFRVWLGESDLELETELKKYIPPAVDADAVEQQISEQLKEETGRFPDLKTKHRFLMGKLMPVCRGHVPAGEVGKRLRRRLEEKDNNHE